MTNAKDLYLDLMKRSLTNWIYGPDEVVDYPPRGFLRKIFARACAKRGIRLVFPRPFDPSRRKEGRDWPPTAHTMIGITGLDNLQTCIEDVLAKGVPGDCIETGVWRGGASIFMRAVLKAHGVTDRRVWVADSFEGLPPPNPVKYPQDRGVDLSKEPELAIPLEEVKANFERYGLLDEIVRVDWGRAFWRRSS